MSDRPKRKERKPRCDECFHRGFKVSYGPTGRPIFTCDHCGNAWSSGNSGQPYIDFVMNPEDRKV